MTKKLTTEEFIQKATEKHGDIYDYSKVYYQNAHTKIIIICSSHGEFEQTPSNHIHKHSPQGCPKCGKEKQLSHRKNPMLSNDLYAIWKTFPNNPTYEVSTNGEIRNNKTKNVLKAYKTIKGYLKTNATTSTPFIHRIVAITFLENPKKLPTVNHKNHKRDDNRVENLEWASYGDQNIHKIGSQTNSCSRGVYRKDIKTGAILQEYLSISDAYVWLKFNKYSNCTRNTTLVGKACRSEINSAYGFRWSYIDAKPIENEKWIPISTECKNDLDKYYVSNKGRIRLLDGRISEGGTQGGYKCIMLNIKQYRIHRLVALTFLPNPNNYPIVNHIDGNKTNNIVENLEWCSQSQNCQHAHDTKLNSTSIKIKLVEHNLEFSSCAKAGEWIKENTQFKKASGNQISTGMKRGQKKVYGFTWAYIE